MGRNLDISLGQSVFGMRQMFVWFKRGSRALSWKKSMTVWRITAAVMPQYFWKKRLVIPSGLGALSGLMSKTALRISSSDGNFVKASFMAGVTFSVIYFKESSKSEGSKEVKRVWKYLVATSSISFWVSSHTPFDFRSFVTRFLALLCLVVAWKNLVFRSHSCSQFARLFCFQ